MKGCAQVISDDKQLLIESAIATLLFQSLAPKRELAFLCLDAFQRIRVSFSQHGTNQHDVKCSATFPVSL